MGSFLSLLKDYRVSLATVIIASMVILWVRDWQFSTFISRIEIAAQNHAIDEKFDALVEATQNNTRTIQRNFNEFRLYTAVKSVEQYEDAVFAYDMYMKTAPKSDVNDNRGASLRNRLAKARAYKRCILENKPDCEELLKMWRERD